MRIRKRQVPLPFSSLSPLPLSDPLLRPVQLHRPTTTTSHAADAPTHLPLPPSGSDPPNLHLYDFAAPHTNALEAKDEQEDDHGHHTRERSVFGAETSNGVLPQSTSSPQVVGRWCEREKAFPLKKRRGSFERPSDDQNNNDDEYQTTTTTTVKSPDQKKTMTTKMNKKCTLPQMQEQQEDQSKLGLNLVGKRKSRGGALMEGSRCSRVNGRGWRCCQQTLVGYSLCEHHLGKGRLRSMNSVRSRSLAAVAAPKSVIVVEEEDEKKPSPSLPRPLTLASKKRMKLGVVKARSISSLLGQPDGVMAGPPPPPLPPTLLDDNIGE